MNSISFGSMNLGNQVGINNGSIHLPPERPETPPPPLSTVPFPRDPDFVDRGSLLDQIFEKEATPGARIALVGLGGVGKSQLAIECCYRIREQSPGTWVFWIHATNAARFEQSCCDMADRVKITGRKDPTANIFKLIHDWLVEEKNGKWVLILDNVDDSSFLHEVSLVGQGSQSSTSSRRPLLTYLPISHHGSIIITSRNRGAANSIVEDNDIITILPMDQSHAMMLFERKLGSQIEKATIMQLVTTLDYMPLAIVQAAAYIKQRTPWVSVQQYLGEFQKSDRKRISLLAYGAGRLRRDREAKNSILITWQISFNHIQQTQPAAADLLSLMSFFDRQGIPRTLLQHRLAEGSGDENMNSEESADVYKDDENSGTDSSLDDDFEENIVMLRNYSMISTGVDGDTFEMHRLVQLAMRKWLEDHGQLERWKHQFIETLDRTFPSGDFETWDMCQLLFSHVQSALTQRPVEEGILQTWASLVHRSAWFAFTKGDIVESEKMANLAMKTRKRLFGPYNEETVDSYAMAGLAYCLSGKWKEAEQLQVQVMETRKQMLGPEHDDTLSSIHNLASTYMKQGRWKEAEELQVQVTETYKQMLGLKHRDTLSSMHNLASTYRDQGRWKEAEELQVQVTKTYKQVLGLEHRDTLSSRHNLASTYRDQGRWKEAEELQVQVMETRKQMLGPEHPSTLSSIANLASTYMNQGRWKEAEELQVQVTETYKQMLGLKHRDTLSSMHNLASTYRDQGDGRKLKTSSVVNLASTYMNQGRWKKSEELQVQVTETYKQVLGPEHPSTLTSIANLASTYGNQGRWKEAEELEVQVMETRKQVLGPEHPSTLNSMSNLAYTFKSLGQFSTALQLMTDCARLRGRILGPDHPDTTSSISALNRWDDTDKSTFSSQ
ncbi:P-loop containing nucleoside triphosphate hydrolase protein [Penicillium fimorum]|uniref:P-loop containing nucleoside triphosphate hydrolase protein n=1 Tax=Penicillium fimorum TaxID=1882269 RepID=A0A9X0C1R3_9EURO|nr:P-loop containing nucleoside triphosphate hydrolase protein [Penicillium fimorum]